jgi:hypothetical protein
MATTQREQILARLVVLLAAVPGVVMVERSRRVAVDRDQTPAILIRPDVDEVERYGQSTDRHGLVAVIVVETRGDPWDAVADPIVAALHTLVMRDPALLAMADVRLMSREPEDTEADATAGQDALHYRFTYLSRADDLGARP